MGRIRAASRYGTCWLAVALLLTAGGVSAQDVPDTVFTAEVSLITLVTTVKDRDGAPVGDLQQDDFTILEEGEPKEIAIFKRRTNSQLSVVLMLDASLSAAIELPYQRQSAANFLRRLLGRQSGPLDAAAIFSFSSDVEELQPFTGEYLELYKSLGRVRAQNGTSVYDAVLLASAELDGRNGRRVIVLITDGGDTTSQVRFADALRAAHRAEVAIYPLIVLPIQSDAGRNRGGEHALITLARNTGGEAFVQYGTANLASAFAEILRHLRTQYTLGFYAGDSAEGALPTFRNVEVRVDREGATVLARSGYFVEPVSSVPDRPRVERAPVRLRTLPRDAAARAGEDGSREAPSTRPPKRPPTGKKRPNVLRPGP